MRSRLFILAMLGFGWAANAETLKVASLSANETVGVEFESDGCFLQLARRYEIHGGPPKSFAAWEVEPPSGHPRSTAADRSAKRIGIVALTPDELLGLDALLVFYRQRRQGGCTTVERIKVEYKRDGKRIGQEEFTDATCAVGMLSTGLSSQELREMYGAQYDLALLKKIVPFLQIEGRMKKKMP